MLLQQTELDGDLRSPISQADHPDWYSVWGLQVELIPLLLRKPTAMLLYSEAMVAADVRETHEREEKGTSPFVQGALSPQAACHRQESRDPSSVG